MDEALLNSEAAMTNVPERIAAEPDIARVPVMIDRSKWTRDRVRSQVRIGQADRQFDQPQGRRGAIPRPRSEVPVATALPWWSWRSTRSSQADTVERKVAICETGLQDSYRATHRRHRHHLRSQRFRGHDR